MKTKDTEALGRQRAKLSKIKAWYSRPTCKNKVTIQCDSCHCFPVIVQTELQFSVTAVTVFP